MKLGFLALAAAISAATAGTVAGAAVVVNPSAGGDYEFGWIDGLGRIDDIDRTSIPDWSLTLQRGGTWTIWVQDINLPGDEFGLVLDDVAVPWDVTDFVNGFFVASATRYFAPGMYLISLDVTAVIADSRSGTALASIRNDGLSPIPLPATLPLLAGALTAFGFSGGRRKRRKG